MINRTKSEFCFASLLYIWINFRSGNTQQYDCRQLIHESFEPFKKYTEGECNQSSHDFLLQILSALRFYCWKERQVFHLLRIICMCNLLTVGAVIFSPWSKENPLGLRQSLLIYHAEDVEIGFRFYKWYEWFW